MIVKTKFNPGDVVFFLHDSIVKQEKIDNVKITLTKDYGSNPVKTRINYSFDYTDKVIKSEENVYSSLALLKKSMIVNKPNK